MRTIALAAVLAGSFLLAAATPSLAFGGDCDSRAVACYDRMRLPDVYATETRSVLLRPAYRTIVPTPPLIRNYVVPVVIRPGRWRTVVAPPGYAMQRGRVVVRPAFASRVYEPPVHGYIGRSVVVRPAGLYVYSHPPVIGVTRDHVLIRPGGYAWVRSRGRAIERW